MATKINVLKIPGVDIKLFENVFCGYVKTAREESDGIESDFNGAIGADGEFVIAKKGKNDEKRAEYESRLWGRVFSEEGSDELTVEYSTRTSRVLIASFVLFTLGFFGFLAYTLIKYFGGGSAFGLYPTIFFAIGFFALLPSVVFGLEVRRLEKVLDKIIGEYASVLEKRKG